MSVFKMIKKLLKYTFIVFVAVCAIQLWLNTKDYIFSDKAVSDVSAKYVGPNVESNFEKIYAEFNKKYPGHILDRSDLQWIFVNAGGWMGSMCLLHASMTEYVLFFGTAMDTRGHSGRYWANISDTIIAGKFEQWKEGALVTQIHKPGDTILHVMGETTAVHFYDNTWMVEYGRGFIPSTLGFALADTFFSTLDFPTLYYILRVYTKAIVQEMSFNSIYYLDLVRKYL